MLVEQLTTVFEPEKYTDEYRTALMELIEEKKAGNNVVMTSEKQTELPSNVTDLMSALQASLDNTKRKNLQQEKELRKLKPLDESEDLCTEFFIYF